MTVLKSLRQTGQALVHPPAPPDGDGQATRGPEHRFSGHTPLWAYINQKVARTYADADQTPLFEVLAPDTPAREAMDRTNLLVFVGAQRSPQLEEALARRETCKLVFEPDPLLLSDLAEELGTRGLADTGCFLFGGDVHNALPPLLRTLKDILRMARFPVFLVQEGLERSHPGYLRRLRETLETGYYRRHVYGAEGQLLSRSRPVRDITRHLFFDQQKHLYENLPDLAAHPDITAVKDALPGTTAILVAAGPDLARRMDWLRDNARRAVVIAISRTAAELVSAGVSPHFAVINDNSLAAEEPLKGLPDMGRTILAAHGLSPLGNPAFRRKLFFGTVLPHILGRMPMLRLHGSVITTAYALARWLGCTRTVLVGAQMSTPDPWTFAYSAGSAVGRPQDGLGRNKPLIGRYPQLVPITAASGRTMYTSVNFLDATRWLLDEIREHGAEVVNTSADSIIHGPGVTVDEDYQVPEGLDADRAFAALDPPPRDLDPAPLARYLRNEQKQWRDTSRAVDNVLTGLQRPGGLEAAARLIEIFDANNTTYLAHRFRDFDNRVFHAKYIEGADEARRAQGAAYLMRYVRWMADEFLEVIARSLARMDHGAG